MRDGRQAGAEGIAVLGGGMSGLCAALTAAQNGANVTVYEAEACAGGSARWSSGRIWSPNDYAQIRTLIPNGDARLQRLLCGAFSEALDWLADGVDDLAPQSAEKFGRGRIMQRGAVGDRTDFFKVFASVCQEAGVRIVYRAFVEQVRRGNDGFEISVTVDGERSVNRAHAVILAGGGFQASRVERARYIGPEATGLGLRSNPQARGSGLAAGLALGGAVSRATSWFYGKSMPPGVELMAPEHYKSLTYDFVRHSVAVNVEGRRFVEEAQGISGEAVANAGLLQPDGVYFLLIDGWVASQIDEAALAAHASKLGRAGGPIMLSAPDYRELAADMGKHWNVDAQSLTETVAQINNAVSLGQPHRITPAYGGGGLGLTASNCHALICRAAITQTLGGLWVSDSLALLDLDGTVLPGVFAAGADAGGVYAGCYGGGLGWALVSGRTAGQSAATYAASARSWPDKVHNPRMETS